MNRGIHQWRDAPRMSAVPATAFLAVVGTVMVHTSCMSMGMTITKRMVLDATIPVAYFTSPWA